MYNTIQIKRRLPDSNLGSGAPASLSAGELAYNEIDNTLYYGASATADHGSVIGIGGPGLFVDRTTTQRISGEKTFFDIATFEEQVNLEKSLSVTENVSANNYFINSGLVIDSSRNATLNNVTADGNLTVTGNLSVLGDFTQIDTQVTTTSAFAITNTGSGPALTVTQTGENAIAAFYDDSDIAFYIAGTTGNAGFVGIGTSTPNEKLTVVGSISATNALTINGTARVNSDLTVVDKIQVQSTDFVLNTAGTHVEIEGSTIKVTDDLATTDTYYKIDGITNNVGFADYTIASTNMQGGHKIIVNSNSGANDIDLTAANVNVTTGDLNGSGTNFITDFIIDGGSF